MHATSPNPPITPTPLPIRLANLVGRGLAKVGVKPRLTCESLTAAAAKKFGSSKFGAGVIGAVDFGEPDVHEPLTVLSESLNHDAQLSPFARIAAHGFLQEILKKRLGLTQRSLREPELAERPIERPIFIVGLPRTGTTLLHNLLSRAPGARSLRTWELMNSADRIRHSKPMPEGGDWTTRSLIRWVDRGTPGLRQVHPLSADNIEECTLLMMNSLVSLGFQLIGPLRRYADWCFTCGSAPHLAAYRLHRFQLHLLPAKRPFDHWVLKAPTHLDAIEELMTIYPTAQIVLTDRDPAQAVPSTCSLFHVVRRMLCDSLDPKQLGPEVGDLLGRAIERSASARERFADRIFPVRYTDLVARPLATVRELNHRLGRPTESAMEDAMQAWLSTNPQHKHGVHRYDDDRFGFDLTAWRRRFGDAYEALFTSPNTVAS